MSNFDSLIVGLGNPGLSEIIRHNTGFLFLDHLNSKFGDGNWTDKGKYMFSHIRLGRWKVALCKPYQNYNVSGYAVADCLKDTNLVHEQMIVVHDDVDLKLCSVRIKSGGGSGGCNGIKSIDAVLETNEYSRIRIGVGRPVVGKVTAAWVCGDFTSSDLNEMEKLYVFMDERLENISGLDIENLRILNKR